MRTGRPTDNPKYEYINIRIDYLTKRELLRKTMQMDKGISEYIRELIRADIRGSDENYY